MAKRFEILQDANPNNPFPGPSGQGCWDNVQNAFVPWYVCGGLGNLTTNSVLNRVLGKKGNDVGKSCNCKH